MPYRVEVPGQAIVEFPDDVSLDDARKSIITRFYDSPLLQPAFADRQNVPSTKFTEPPAPTPIPGPIDKTLEKLEKEKAAKPEIFVSPTTVQTKRESVAGTETETIPWDFQMLPILPLPEGTDASTGLGRAAVNLWNGLQEPSSILAIGGLPQRAVAGFFAYEAAKSMPDAVVQFSKAETPAEKTESGANIVLSILTTALGMKGATLPPGVKMTDLIPKVQETDAFKAYKSAAEQASKPPVERLAPATAEALKEQGVQPEPAKPTEPISPVAQGSTPSQIEPNPGMTAGEGISVGPGAMTSGQKLPSEIEQLTESFKGIEGKKQTLGDKVKEAFNIKPVIESAQSALGSALQSLKNAGHYLIWKWKGYGELDDILKVKGELSAQMESRGWAARQFAAQASKAIPTKSEQAAITKWVDAGGDLATLQQGELSVPNRYKQAYRDAQNLSPDAIVAAKNLQNYFESKLQEAIDAGVLEHGVLDYMHRIFEPESDWGKRATAYVQSGILSQNPKLAMKRTFQFDWQAEQAGKKPVQSFIDRIVDYETSLNRAIAARAAVQKFQKLKMPDGRPMLDVAGVGIPIEGDVDVKPTTLIKPSTRIAKSDKPIDQRNDYVHRDYPSLKKWKWASKDTDGNPIFVQGDLLVHPDAVRRIDSLLAPSWVRTSQSLLAKAGRVTLGVSGTMKQTMMDLSLFHPVQITLHFAEHQLPHAVYDIINGGHSIWVVDKLDLQDPKIEGLLKGGMTLGGDHRYSQEGLMGQSLSKLIPGIGRMTEDFRTFVFQNWIPRVKATMALDALERNRTRYASELKSGRMSEEDLNYLTAREANAAFGEQSYIMLERSKTAQDALRATVLAPDFFEARARFVGQALTKHGGEQRVALAFGALALWTTARIMNQAINGQPHNELENAFSVVIDGHSYSLRTIQGDILHAITKPVQFLMYRANPVTTRAMIEAATGRDAFGRSRSFWEQVTDEVSTAVPITLRNTKEKHLWESLLQGLGVTNRRWTEVDQAFKLAKEFKKQHGIQEKGEFIYDPEKDPLRGLKISLYEGDTVKAAQEIQALKKAGVTGDKLQAYFERYATMPFTGSAMRDAQMMKTLSEDQRATMKKARQNKTEILKRFGEAYRLSHE